MKIMIYCMKTKGYLISKEGIPLTQQELSEVRECMSFIKDRVGVNQ